MTVVNTTDAGANFQDLINRAEYKGERILIQRHGKAVAAIVNIEDLRFLETIEENLLVDIFRVGKRNDNEVFDTPTDKSGDS